MINWANEEIPAKSCDWYVLIGAGSAKVDIDARTMQPMGDSAAYGMGIDSAALNDIGPFFGGWKILK